MNIKKFTPPYCTFLGNLRLIKSLVFMVVMIVTTSNSFAQAHFETIDGLRYLIDENAKAATLVANPDEKYSGDIVVPEKVTAKDEKEYIVKALWNSCFSGCGNLASISLPSSITMFGNDCFNSCYKLTQINIPSSTTSLGDNCFYDCINLESINFSSSSVASLGSRCFYNCPKLTDIILPSSIKSLGDYCFVECKALESVTILSNEVISLGCNCFLSDYYGEALKLIVFHGDCPKNLTGSGISMSCMIYVPKIYYQNYVNMLGSNYYIFAWDGDTGGVNPTQKCSTPTITYTEGCLLFSSSTIGAEYHYTITDADMANDKLVQDGKVVLSAAYQISVYATADSYQPSDKATATLYWINANLENDPSTNINQAKTRGIVASSDGGIVTLSGLANGEIVTFFSPDGRQLGAAKTENGIASCAVGNSIVIAKIGSQNIKLVVK